jgi:cytochrome c553
MSNNRGVRMKKMLFAVALFGTMSVTDADTSNKVPVKAASCVACHGQEGKSPNPLWPNLAGQHSDYIAKQLHDFKQGTTRNAPTMTAMVANLSDADMAELALYYSQLPIVAGHTPQKFLTRGEALYRGGDFDKHISACIACHGPRGSGNAQAGFPALSGQQASYTLLQLQLFKQHLRHNDLNNIMQDIAGRMDNDDMTAVAYYLQGLH